MIAHVGGIKMAWIVQYITFCLSTTMLTRFTFAQTNCTRIFHSAVINNDTLFIGGGDMHTLWPNDTITPNSIHDLETIDLSKSWSNSDSDLYSYIKMPDNASHPADYPPSLDEGVVWSDGHNLYFYGGYNSLFHGPPVPPLATWRYDIAANNWTSKGFSGAPLVRLCQGGAVQSSVDKVAYYLSGSLNPGGNPTFFNTPGADVYMDSGLISLHMSTLTWSNASTADMNTWGTIGDGYVGLIESVGDQGLLVAFGGYTYPVGQKLSYLAYSQKNVSHQNSMEMVRVYDIAKQAWYTQQTSGDIPRWRMSGCTVVAAAPDLSSYSIYIFGGMAPTTDESDGNVYVLSVPSFRWIRVSDGNTIRIKHKCLLARKKTMIVVGGITPITNREYDPLKQNCDSSTFANGVGIFDLRSLSWNTDYNASDTGEYTIPSKISDVIGGSETGEATMTEPEGGFNNTALKELFGKRTIRPTSSVAAHPTTSPTSGPSPAPTEATGHSLSSDSIAGVTIGSIVAAVMICALVFIIMQRRRRANPQKRSIIPWQEYEIQSYELAEGPSKELQGASPQIHELGV